MQNLCKFYINYKHFMYLSNGPLVSINYANCLFSCSIVTTVLNLFAQFVIQNTSEFNQTL